MAFIKTGYSYVGYVGLASFVKKFETVRLTLSLFPYATVKLL